jgi:flagellar hook-associated protein 2
MSSIQSPGIGSGLDINSIVTQLVAAEQTPVKKRLDNEETLAQARLSSLGVVKSAVSDFQTAVSSLTSLSSFQSKSASVANAGLMTASVSSAAKTGQYSVEVAQLAQAQKLVSKSFTNSTGVVGTGTLHFKFGTYDSGTNKFSENAAKPTQDIAISASNNSLKGIRDSINAAKIGVTASILNDGTGDRLVVSSESGAAQSLQLSVTDDDSNPTNAAGLSQLAYDPTAVVGSGKNMEQTLEAKDAQLKVDGISITRPTNSVTGVLPGVTLDLQNSAPNVPTTLTVAANTTNISDSINKFVKSFNSLKGVLNQATKYDATAKKASLLTGDSAIRGMNSQLQRVIGDVISGLGSNLKSLPDIGITTAKDGTLDLDSAKLNSALSQNIDAFSGLFATTGSATDSLVGYINAGTGTKVGSYDVNVTQVATQGNYSNSVGTGPFTVDASNDTFKIKVDGFQSGSIALTNQAGITGDQLALDMQTKINDDTSLRNAGRSVIVAYDSGTGNMTIKSSRYGSDSQIDVTQISAQSSTIGLTIKAGNAGQNVAGTIGGVAATGSGTRLTGGVGDAQGLVVDITGTTTGSRGKVNYSKGYAEQLNNVLSGFLSTNGTLTQRINDYNTQIAGIGVKRTALAEHLTKVEADLRTKFSAMDAIVGKLKSTGDYLTGQLAALAKNNSSN